MENQKTILVVDDEDRNLRLMEAMLIPLGYAVTKACNGDECLKVVEESPPDVILLDVMMPGMDGFEVARRLKNGDDTMTIPIVMVTALQGVEDRVKALEAGADDFLTKPVEKTELKARVQSLVKVKAYYDHMQDYQKTLEETVAKRTRQLNDALQQTKLASLDSIIRLSRAAEYKDEHTGAHIGRMSRYAAEIARAMEISDETVESILYAAPMHDIGKIGIPDNVLMKPDKLDHGEWEVMKQHTIIGAHILDGSTSRFANLGKIIALTHHEKWNGKGYPQGLKGTAIPLSGRIVAVADVFDALTSHRPYRRALPVDVALSIIQESRGGHFDPDVVDAFFDVEDEIRKIKESYSE